MFDDKPLRVKARLRLPRLYCVKIGVSISGVADVAWGTGDKLQGGKYTVERELGRGRFGITYLVRKSNNDRQVVKTLNDDLLKSLSQSERGRLETMFWQEAVKLTRCKHQHIVQVAEPFKEGEHWCLVMEYVDGVSLADRRQPILSEQEALRYIQQIGEALKSESDATAIITNIFHKCL
ncbi:serine/threonine protein kinase [Komarekiella delphini-convector]|uniref:serine/threonine protein kinase n=1 Tax=Komarekiella delphini-convector TaxID=3050158 RepID=UPI001CD89E82|nr:protein kinase [Komarekiella delphini-convector]